LGEVFKLLKLSGILLVPKVLVVLAVAGWQAAVL
jgi:hypothetical protein